MSLTSTQIGAIGENLLANEVMKASEGRLSPFQPLADDDGLDALFYDKQTGNAVAIQLKCRTVTLFKPGTKERGNLVHFDVRQATFNEARRAYLVAGLLDDELTRFQAFWLIPMEVLPALARDINGKWVIRPNVGVASNDRFSKYRCLTPQELAIRITAICESHTVASMRKAEPENVASPLD
jgi:hypothetical protein